MAAKEASRGGRALCKSLPHIASIITRSDTLLNFWYDEAHRHAAQSARETLENAIRMVEQHPQWDAHVVYGDTDSLFVQLPGRRAGHECTGVVLSNCLTTVQVSSSIRERELRHRRPIPVDVVLDINAILGDSRCT